MWISREMRSAPPTADADLGLTTISGGEAGVLTRGEVRSLPVYGPGGYVWLPENGAAVLVIKGGPGGAEQCVAGARQAEAPAGMEPGEVFLRGPGGNSLYLKRDGSVVIRGNAVFEGGVEFRGGASVQGGLTVDGEPYAPCACE